MSVWRALVAGATSSLCAVVLTVSTSAHGQWEADRATARNLAAEGNAALSVGDFTTAEDRFRRADSLVHAPTLVVDHAKALIGLHRYVEAQERLELVIREGVPDNAPWVWKRALQDAKQLVEDVKPKVAWVTINVTGSTRPEVYIDDVEVPVAVLGVRRATDPGQHRITASAPGYLKKEIALPVSEGSERAVSIELQPDPAARKRVKRTPVATQVRTEAPTERKNGGSWLNSTSVGYAALGVGGLGLVVGSYAGVKFLSKRSSLQDACPDPHNCSNQPLMDEYSKYGTISGIGLGVGVVGTAAGLWLLLREHPVQENQHRASVTLSPFLSVGRVGVEGAF